MRPEKIRILDDGAPRRTALHVEGGTIADVAYAGMITRYVVALDAGGELQVVRQNLETSSAEALEDAGGRCRSRGVRSRRTRSTRVPQDQEEA